jgi:predicted Zn-dependent protease
LTDKKKTEYQPLGKVGVFFLGHAGFDHMAAVGRVVFFLQALTSFLARQGA